MYRQGDVFLKRISKRPSGLKKCDGVILAEGEVTGHQHKIVAEKASDFQIYQNEDGVMYLEVAEPVELYHGTERDIEQQMMDISTMDFEKLDLHKPHTIVPGFYEVPIERDYVPEGWRQVAD